MCASDAHLVMMTSSCKHACVCVIHETPLVAVLLVARGGVVLQKLRDLRIAPFKESLTVFNLNLMLKLAQ